MTDVFDLLEECLNTEFAKQADLTQIRGHHRQLIACTARNDEIENMTSASLSGSSVRVLTDMRSWGFSSVNKIDVESIVQAMGDALSLARSVAPMKKIPLNLSPIPGKTIEVAAKVEKPPLKAHLEEIADIVLESSRGALATDPSIETATSTFIAIEDDKHFVSSEGARIHLTTTRIQLSCEVIAKKDGNVVSAQEFIGHTGGLELCDETRPHDVGEMAAKQAISLLEASVSPGGEFPVVIGPKLCATLLHEAIGHPLEADLGAVGGGFSDRIGEQVSSPLVSIYDDGQIIKGLGYLPFDDEGVECKKTVLIEEGILKGYMHDRTSAAMFDTESTGNAHAWDYSVEPMIRQTNIGLEGGTHSFEELFEGIDTGLYLEGTLGGQADSNANFMFGYQSARWIRNGELTDELLKGASVSGNAIQVFSSIDAISNEPILRPGACGKFQWAIQGRIVPAIRCKIMVGGMGG